MHSMEYGLISNSGIIYIIRKMKQKNGLNSGSHFIKTIKILVEKVVLLFCTSLN